MDFQSCSVTSGQTLEISLVTYLRLGRLEYTHPLIQ